MPTGLLMKYFVLKPQGWDGYAQASRAAMTVYADVTQNVNPDLALDLREWVAKERSHLRAQCNSQV